ncbi:AraC family transcriptional regulator [Ferdinandcohnia quinoae]|uniref:AraC family transcriptional regulator n=1 Tax=Fredinandcohnia quinoae TaxID=2918902 RepID=A0AAW5EB87_9BACI|nr:AraC family transcriptional regulator [Fredinandcohnia sp. SECRCQ15]MCH1626433.1 AraC family transcriptional regulator [Fredinandcohnia sp. SECRCQ15]
MAWVESLQKAIDFIEMHLLEEITIEEIANEANASPFHFQRTFAILTDATVGEYIRRRRLTLAAEDLTRSEDKIIDLAYKYGYDTPEAFTKAFRRQHGLTPSDARKGVGKLQSYNRLVIQVSLKGAEPVKYSIVEREAFKVVGVKREFSCVNDEHLAEIPKLWDKVNSDGTCDSLIPLINGQIKGIVGVCVSAPNTNSIDYWVAVEHTGEVPDEFLHVEIPAAKWAVFEVHGAMPYAMQDAWKRIYSEWFPSSGYEYAGTAEMEVYTGDNPSDPNCYSEIWIPVK